jgi:CRISPR/Cas system CSM-associated protein Csm3 (group 7 of RAMP superfamily)
VNEPVKSREIAARLCVEGKLKLVTPAHLGNGDAESITAMPLLLDPVEQRPLLTGTSIAGALRGYLYSYERGYRRSPDLVRDQYTLSTLLFGGLKGDDQGDQSPLIVSDALGTLPDARQLEVRDGVKIDYRTRTADEKKKYDLELLPAGTCFDLRFELLLPAEDKAQRLRLALALALQGLTADHDGYGAIALGARRSRGFGRCRVAEWQFKFYDLQDPASLLGWLASDYGDWPWAPTAAWQGTSDNVFGAQQSLPSHNTVDVRRSFQIDAWFALDSPILIRSSDPLPITDAEGNPLLDGEQPDVAHLRSFRPRDNESLPRNTEVPIVPGTSLAGVLRGRATRIVNTLGGQSATRAQALLDLMFGSDMHQPRVRNNADQPTASRLIVEENPIQRGHYLIQNRVSIDRFTGGAYDTALFAEGPQVGGNLHLRLTLRLDQIDLPAAITQVEEHAQIGLLLLLLKDLWTGDLPLGGTSSIGRGRLSGCEATLSEPDGTRWRIKTSSETNGQLDIQHMSTQEDSPASNAGTPPVTSSLERYVAALRCCLES